MIPLTIFAGGIKMNIMKLAWSVGYTNHPDTLPKEMYPASVPGAAQQDYAKAKGWDSFQFGVNCRDYAWMEDVYWLYQAPLDFSLDHNQAAVLIFKGIDYQYRIRIDGRVLYEGEGMFTPIRLDVTEFAGSPHMLEVLLYPVPKCDDSGTRSQARFSCKPAACYGWDWHPRLISSGIYDESGLMICRKCHIVSIDTSYVLSDALDHCRLNVHLELSESCRVRVAVLFRGTAIVQDAQICKSNSADFHLDISQPSLWFPTGYGAQNVYTLLAEVIDEDGNVLDEATRKIGFRRAKLVMNEGSWSNPKEFPKSRSDAPATLEINGIRVFAKGSNWVNAHVFPGVLTSMDYASLLALVKEANMNLLRIWGGGFVNHEAFYELCDELGIMVWQEFPLACNEYPDDDHYLSVLEQEATSIVRRLRSHPCLVLWCGGNELFNSWSKMTDQHHALRLLNKVCYSEDRYTPFIMTSPLNGMAHGHYQNYDEEKQAEFISSLVRAENTAYTEFGSPSAASPEYIQNYISADDYAQCSPENEVWTTHHAFGAWRTDTWLRKAEADYYFGGYESIEDLCEKTQFIQAMCYRSYFEEMRRQWPHCSMALNWCFNEPWPTFANNSLISWPDLPKPGYYAVQAALRPQLASMGIDRHLWWAGDIFHGEIWILNDALSEIDPTSIEISYGIGDEAPTLWGTLQVQRIAGQSNCLCGSVSFPLPANRTDKIHLWLKVSGHREMDSEYTYLFRSRTVISTAGMLNV